MREEASRNPIEKGRAVIPEHGDLSKEEVAWYGYNSVWGSVAGDGEWQFR